MQQVYILGIGGTFMGHLALLARQLGCQVSGCDANVYSPMKELLIGQAITFDEGYDPSNLPGENCTYIIGNALSRGNAMIEAILNRGYIYTSGPAWLAEHVLRKRWVVAIAGTHGKTTTTSMVAWILKQRNLKPGYLIGGAAKGFAQAAELGEGDFFVIEADEYDTAFFDKRSKFIHYQPKTLLLNNLEFDHSDIFADLAAIETTMHHVVRTVPSSGHVVWAAQDQALTRVLARGCWSQQHRLYLGGAEAETEADNSQSRSRNWYGRMINSDGSRIMLSHVGESYEIEWNLLGRHNMANALAALAVTATLGIVPKDAIDALKCFPGVTRRMDELFNDAFTVVIDDFAHHPTAIQTSLQALRARVQKQRILAIVEPRSNTMAQGSHHDSLQRAVVVADEVCWLMHDRVRFDPQAWSTATQPHYVFRSGEALLGHILRQRQLEPGQLNILSMSNGSLDGVLAKLVDALAQNDAIQTPKAL